MTVRRDPVRDLLSQVHHIDVLQSLSSALPYLSSAEQAVAHFILSHPEQVASMGAGQLAEASGVSEATVFRLCRQLGLPGYSGMREQVGRARANYADSFLAPIDFDQGRATAHGLMESMAYSGIRSLLDALVITDSEIERVTDALVSAERIILSGVGAYTGRICEMAAFGLQRIGLTCMLWIDGQTSQVRREMLHQGDVVVGLSYSGGNKPVANLLSLANEVGATTVSLTNYRFSPVSEQAKIPLVTAFRESGIQNFELLPRLSQLLVIQVLIKAADERLRRVGQKNTG